MLFAYFGPETALPVASTLAAVVGIILVSGRQAGRLLISVSSRVGRSVVGRRRWDDRAVGPRGVSASRASGGGS